MKARKSLATSVAVLMGALALAACGGSDDTSAGGDGDVELTFWHNSTTGDGKAYWDATAAAFEEANPGVTVKIQSIQNEDMDGKLQTALNSGDAPDIFMARGGGKLADIVDSGQVMDLTDKIDDDVREAVGGALDAFAVDGKVYGMPTAVLPGGIWYSKDLFAQAGITETPTTMAELEDAVAKLKAAGIQPIALGGKDAWPAAHWYYFFALRACSQDTINESAAEMNFDDPCWTEAGQAYADFAGIEPFNNGFLTTTAQQGAGSSAGLLANHQAAMELMGAWNPGVIAGLTPDGEPLADLGWFPFPAIEGGKGDATAMMGGVDGYACHVDAPDACADFLNFYMKQEHQEGYAEAFVTLPASKDAQGAVTDPALQDVLASYNDAAYVSVWLDTLLGQNVGNALNAGVVDMLAGDGDADSIVAAVKAAAAKE
ncbi:ABC transporter substrate-binding protein [Cellulomonas wangsupingiae]|uniref:Extracellular solute-binding protein n=1 Tax=Cellulomonas wangsupingiae TaxID=2968085 RepID=A0ABY5K653_9CELL|nr:extracellular solute-binding protein [Cellulomonas wangsupingiae]MCC2336496.1 extracellular solute-binding protein [Cellulomonas wangsupingiae]MCM0641556.1 extracellular solute-binding protein [Cellulomonas wangsupingiae]UUI64627.1 extracellular solute-binding protein [Cellulomonas wangsupingiae]